MAGNTTQGELGQGRERRQRVPRSAHAAWSPPVSRRDPVATLEAQAATRVAALVPIRYSRMSESAFAFYRGAAAIMAQDLATLPATGIRAQLCGDAHLVNFGGYATPERNLVFDVNDFDETLPGPFEWDVKRLAASFVIAGRSNGFTSGEGRRSALALVATYRSAMQRFADDPYLTTWYARLTSSALQAALPSAQRKGFADEVRRVTTEDPLRPIAKLTERVQGVLRLRHQPPLLYRLGELPGVDQQDLRDTIMKATRLYRRTLPLERRRLLDRYQVIDIAHKVVGVGSVGLRAFIVLMRGRSGDDLLVLQVKEARASVLEQFLDRSEFRWPGERVVQGQRVMQASSDIFLGWLGVSGQPAYYLRQMRDWKVGVDVARLDPPGLTRYAKACGWTLARAHARSGEPALIAGYLGSGDRFDGAIADFAEAYASQNDLDYGALKAAIADGRVVADPMG